MSSNWDLKNISELVENLNYKRIPLSKMQREKKKGLYPYYGASGVFDYVDDYLFNGTYLLVSEDGENLRTRKTPIAFKAEGKFWVNNHAHILAEKEEGVLDYLEYYFSILNVDPYITGAVQPKLNRGNLEQINIYIPKKKLRLKINSILNSITSKIEKNNEINQTLEAMAQAIFKSWFVDFDPVHAKAKAKLAGLSDKEINLAAIRVISSKTAAELEEMAKRSPTEYKNLQITASYFPDEFKESELGLVPKGWQISTVGEEYNITMGQSPKGESYNEEQEGILFFQGRAEFGWRYPTPRLYTTDPKRMADKGDVLMSVRAPVGDFNIALEDCCIGRGLASLRHKSGSQTYSFYHLLSLQYELDRYNGEGTVFGSINQANLKNISVISPNKILIDMFIKNVSVLDKRIENNAEETLSLINLRDTLLPKLLSGEIEI